MSLAPYGPTDDSMCLRHITDPHLAIRVKQDAHDGDCAICITDGLRPDGPVISLAIFAGVVSEFVERGYDHEGFVVDGEQIMQPLSTEDVVERLLAEAVEPDAIDLVVGLITALIDGGLDWFEPFDIDNEAGIQFEWDDFEQSVKHETRLLSPTEGRAPASAPERNYTFVRSLLVLAQKRAGLVRTIPTETPLFRARAERDARKLEQIARKSPATTLGPPPVEKATAGRMNAQGVPMLYVAEDVETACAEVASHSPYDEVVAGVFFVQRPLRILDLSRTPPRRSPFDEAWEQGDERLNSLDFYKERITRPVILDENHPVDYVASQTLTEAFRWWSNPRLDGIAYPSRVREGGNNIVLFHGDSASFGTRGEPTLTQALNQRDFEQPQEPLFVADPASVGRYRVTRDLYVTRSII